MKHTRYAKGEGGGVAGRMGAAASCREVHKSLLARSAECLRPEAERSGKQYHNHIAHSDPVICGICYDQAEEGAGGLCENVACRSIGL